MTTKIDMTITRNGWVDPYQWRFVPIIKDKLAIIWDELESLTNSNPLLAYRLGFSPKSWITKELNCREISVSVESWIHAGGFHEAQTGYDYRKGGWFSLPLFLAGHPETQVVTERYLPFTAEALLGIPKLQFAGFFKQSPSGEVKTHQHSQNRRIFHFLLTSLNGGHAWIEVEGERRILQTFGDCLGFDVRTPHSSGNTSIHERINLVLEVEE